MTEWSIDRKGDASTGHRTDTSIGGADRRERQINRRGGAHIMTDERNDRQNKIPTIPAIFIEIYQLKEELEEGNIDRK